MIHEVVRTVDTFIEHNQYTLVAFIDLERAFNNVTNEANYRSLTKIAVNSIGFR